MARTADPNYEVFKGETREKRAFEDRHASTRAYIEFMGQRCVNIHHMLKKMGLFALLKSPPTQDHALRNDNCIASVGSGGANCKGTV